MAKKRPKTEKEWQETLTNDEFRVLRGKGTERPFSGKYLDNKEKGVYVCAGCGNELFTSDAKFDSGGGWPSFRTLISRDGDLWDNGIVDGRNGLSVGLFSGLNRELTDDFVADAPWLVSDGHFRVVTYLGYGPECVSQVDVYFYNDIAGVPDTSPFLTYTAATFSGWVTGNTWFARPEFEIDVEFGPAVLTPGTYWVEFQPTATDNIFWLTSADSGSMSYLSYPDLGFPKWTSSYVGFGMAYDLNFILTGTIAGVEHDVGVTSIVSPSSGNGQVFTPKVTVANNGNNSEYDVPVHMTIDRWVPPATPVYYMNEQFTSWMPTGWTQTGHWTQNMYNYAGGTSPEAKLYYGTAVDGEFLMSASIVTTGLTHLHLSWRGYIDWYSAGCSFFVETRADSVDGWTPRQPWTNPITGNVGPALYDVDISDDIGVDTQVRFRFQGTPFNFDNWYVDNVQFFVPGVPGYYENEYNETVLVDIPLGAKLDVTFPLTWTPEAYQVEEDEDFDYHVWAATEMDGDEIPSDDAKTKDITLHFPFLHDMGIEQIISPVEDGLGQTLPVKVMIKNYGQFPERWFNTDVQIGSEIQTPTYSEDFEASNGGYAASGTFGLWQWGIPYYGPGAPHSGAKCWGTSYYGAYYTDYANEKLDTVAIAVPTNGRLAFWHWFSTESYYDGGNVKISVSPYTTWTVIGSYLDPYNEDAMSTGNSGIPGEPGFSGSSGGWEHIILDLTAYASQTVKFRFHFGSDSSVATYPGWYVDDVEVYGVSLDPEYDDQLWQNPYLNPGATKELTFAQWTPEALLAGISGDISYIVSTQTLLPGDSNTANDNMAEMFTLSYFHDVTVKKITEPSKGGIGVLGDVIFSQPPYGPTEWLSAYTSSSQAGYGYVCQEDFYGLTDTIGDVEWWGLQGLFAGGWTEGDPIGSIYEIKFYEDASGVPGPLVATFSDLEPDIVEVGDYGWYSPLYYFAVTLPGSVDLAAGWLSIDNTYTPDASAMLWMDSPTGNLNALQNGGALGDNLAYNLTSGGGPQGPPPVTVYVAKGSKPVAAIVNNVGTFVENGLTSYAEIKQFIDDPINGTSDYTDDVPGINLNPLGEEKTINFNPYNYQREGIYGLYVSLPLIPPELDDHPNNNQKAIGIGCDATPPTSSHILSPATPNGNNSWYVSDVTVTVTSTDPTSHDVASGVQEIQYKIDSGTWQTKPGNTATFKVTTDGNHVVQYKGVDKVGNEETPKSVSFKVDKTKPDMIMSYEVTGGNSIQGWELTFTVNATDATSGMDKVEFYFNGNLQTTVTGAGPTYTWVFTYFPLPNVDIMGKAYDKAGNNRFEIIHNPQNSQNQQSQQSHIVLKQHVVR